MAQNGLHIQREGLTRLLPPRERSISLLVAKVKEDRVGTIIEKLTAMTSAKDDALRDVASLGASSLSLAPAVEDID